MDLTIFRLKPLLKRLDRLALAVERIADAYEAELHSQIGYTHLTPGLSKEDRKLEVMYTDEEQDAIREIKLKLGIPLNEEEETKSKEELELEEDI